MPSGLYGPPNTEVRIYDDELIVWNPGGLPLGLTVEDLFKPHPSVLRNKGIGGGLRYGFD